jgi:formate hydrogenlyase transcriptional activator
MFPLTTAMRPLGAIGFGSQSPCAFGEAELEFLQQVAKQVAVAVDNVLNYESAQVAQQQLARERDRLRLLLDVNNAVVSTLDLRDLFTAISANLRQVMRADMTSLGLYEPGKNQIRLHALDFPDSKGLFQEGVVCPMTDSPVSEALRSRQPVLHSAADFEKLPTEIGQILMKEGIKSACCVPLISHGRLLGTLTVASRREVAFSPEDVDLLTQVAGQISIAVENALAYRQIAELKDKLTEEKLYLEDEIRTEYNFEEIIGESSALKMK